MGQSVVLQGIVSGTPHGFRDVRVFAQQFDLLANHFLQGLRCIVARPLGGSLALNGIFATASIVLQTSIDTFLCLGWEQDVHEFGFSPNEGLIKGLRLKPHHHNWRPCFIGGMPDLDKLGVAISTPNIIRASTFELDIQVVELHRNKGCPSAFVIRYVTMAGFWIRIAIIFCRVSKEALVAILQEHEIHFVFLGRSRCYAIRDCTVGCRQVLTVVLPSRGGFESFSHLATILFPRQTHVRDERRIQFSNKLGNENVLLCHCTDFAWLLNDAFFHQVQTFVIPFRPSFWQNMIAQFVVVRVS
mmetsp:Transcript_23132/g.50330  ORF Transcript_23132/g.50330 Transcript_23132/m.50330 type:complete len:301 (+) Transcript_23132:3114-4016(+)